MCPFTPIWIHGWKKVNSGIVDHVSDAGWSVVVFTEVLYQHYEELSTHNFITMDTTDVFELWLTYEVKLDITMY